MYSKYIILEATTHINIREVNPQTKCGFHLQVADSTYSLRIPLKCFIICLWIPQTVLNSAYFSSDFERYNYLGTCLWNPKQHRRSKKSSKVGDLVTNLILVCCGFRLKCRECTVWPRNDIKFNSTQI